MRTLFWKLSSTALLVSGLTALPLHAEETEARGPVPTRGSDGDSAVYRASDVMNLPVKNDDGSEVGRVKDLVINGESREVLYAVVAMNDGKEKDVVYIMPWTVFQPSFGQGNTIQYTTLGLARSVWLQAPYYSTNQWRSAVYSQWGPKVNNYYSSHVTNIRNFNSNNNSITTRKPVIPDKDGRNNDKNNRDGKGNDSSGKNDDKDDDKSARDDDKNEKPQPRDKDEKPQANPKNEPVNKEKPAPKEPAPKEGGQAVPKNPQLPAPKNPDPPGPKTPAPAPRDPKVPK